ncbi:MAG: F0F1 ATP synthase subunit epsilon [Acidobacteria bacterium]|nr:F0F1 ATP synthase subunit epsilon [Acidobacteriota bacterium]
MLPDKITLEVLTPDRRVLSAEADEVVMPGVGGSFGVRPGHHPMIVALEAGQMIVRGSGHDETFAVGGGFAEVLRERVSVLASTCERADDIDVIRAQRALERATKRLRGLAPGIDRERAGHALHCARARLWVARRSSEG